MTLVITAMGVCSIVGCVGYATAIPLLVADQKETSEGVKADPSIYRLGILVSLNVALFAAMLSVHGSHYLGEKPSTVTPLFLLSEFLFLLGRSDYRHGVRLRNGEQ